MGDTHPAVARLVVPVAAAAAGATTSGVARAPFAGTVTSVTYVGAAAITGAATNNRTHSVLNRLQDGSGSAVAASLNYASGTNAAAFDEKDITLSGTPANLVVAEGDILEARSAFVGTGIAEPGGVMLVTVTKA
jgi:hypothetical protein